METLKKSSVLKTFHPPRVWHAGSQHRYHNIYNMPKYIHKPRGQKSVGIISTMRRARGPILISQLCYAARFGGVQFLHPGVLCCASNRPGPFRFNGTFFWYKLFKESDSEKKPFFCTTSQFAVICRGKFKKGDCTRLGRKL